LIPDAAWAEFQAKQQRMEEMKQLLECTKVSEGMVAPCGEGISARPPSEARPVPDLSALLGQPLAQCLKRPEISIEQLVPALLRVMPAFFERNSDLRPLATDHLSSEVRNELKAIETEIKYAGYLGQQQRAIDRLKKAEQRRIPDWFDYRAVSGLSREMQEKLLKIQPQTLGQASRIPGVTPAAVSLVNVYIEIQGRRREQTAAI
jgi:tRNA uridine 5-carboxymethylaminomethyl modification enzyme